MYILLELTNNCILQCEHCMVEAGPGGESASREDLEKIIGNLPEKVDGVMISGGEAFTRKELLGWTIERLKQARPGLENITVQTNGYWAKDLKRARFVVYDLLDKGAAAIQLSSNKLYHMQAGLDMEARKNLRALALEGLPILVADERHPEKVFPVGGAWNINSRNWADEQNAYCWQMDEYAGIGMKGQAYACWWYIKGTELGDVRKEKLTTILERAKQNPTIRTLNQKEGAVVLARQLGVSDIEDIEAYKRAGNCGLCSYLFRNKLARIE